jgi:hypothetical protein
VSRRWKAIVEVYPYPWLRLRVKETGSCQCNPSHYILLILNSDTAGQPALPVPRTPIAQPLQASCFETPRLSMHFIELSIPCQQCHDSEPFMPYSGSPSINFRLLRVVVISFISFHLTIETPFFKTVCKSITALSTGRGVTQ